MADPFARPGATTGHANRVGVRVVLALATLTLCGGQPEAAPPQPCAGVTVPAYPSVGAPPALVAWDRTGLGRQWVPPPCTGWTEPGFTSLVGLAARFRQPAGVAGLLRRVGAISGLAGIRYWSATSKQWKTLVVQAGAVTGPTGAHDRADFTPEELTPGAILYFNQEDNHSGKATYRLRVRVATEDSLVFETENVTPIRYLMWPLFKPGELQSIYFFQREAGAVWRFYSLARTGRDASALTNGHEASFKNRAVALFRHLAGIPTDQEPPGAP